MLNFRPVLLVTGILLSILAAAMLIPAIFDFFTGQNDWAGFLISAFITAFVGITIVLTNMGAFSTSFNIKQAFTATFISWLSVAFFASLPFYFAGHFAYVDSFFEAMSGFTTTGSTIIADIDKMPSGILLWRSVLQWVGGLSFILLTINMLPFLKIGGMQLFRTEAAEQSDKVLPRTLNIALALGGVYVMITVIYAISLCFAGMGLFDAVNYAMCIISTGGFSTHNESVAYFDNSTIEYMITIFMIFSCFPFLLHVRMLRGEYDAYMKDVQIKWFLFIIASTICAITTWLVFKNNFNFWDALRESSFNVVSIISTTGFTSTDYSVWGGFIISVIFMLSVVGGCAGSASGGIKIFRYQILYQMTSVQIAHLIQPHAILRTKFNKKPISDEVAWSVMMYIVVFAGAFMGVAMALSFCGFTYMEAMTAAASALANVGSALDMKIGTSDSYAQIPDMAKWVLSAAMLLGRLELYTVLIVLTPGFWRN